jgi:hypothetical protein
MLRKLDNLAVVLIMLGSAGLAMSGCTTVGSDIDIPMGELALHDTVPVPDSIAKLDQHIADARRKDMPFLAPHYFQAAVVLVKKIKNTPPQDVSVEDLARADVILDKGEAAAERAKRLLSPELDLMSKLDKLSANELYPWRYRVVMYNLSSLIERVELEKGGNTESSRRGLMQSMRELYDMALKHAASQYAR